MKTKIRLSFLTGNSHKFSEAKEALAPFSTIELTQIKKEKIEIKDDESPDPLKEIAVNAALAAVSTYGVPVAVEDAGIFFSAYQNFPGLNTKWIMKKTGYDGILRLLAGKDRGAYFRSIVAYCEPGGDAVFFEGIIEGAISEKLMGLDVDCMDYDRIFIPRGETNTFSLLMDKKKKMSHRKIAFGKLGEYLQDKTQ